MGAAVSSGGHPSHPEHNARFRRVAGGDHRAPPSRCRMCNLTVELGAPAYHCSEPKPDGCAVVLHEACYRRPKKMTHSAHPQHRLTLAGDALALAAGVSCSLCACPFGTPPVAYSCTRRRCAGGFRVHPRCCDLPKSISVPPELHDHGDLVLRPPTSSSGNGGEQRRRRCLSCSRVAGTISGQQAAAPWSYQCAKCVDIEYCLACLLGDDDAANMRCCCFQCCTVDPAAVQCLGNLAGVFFCAFLGGMGCPTAIPPTQPSPGGIGLTRNRN
ncbi:hypothetical protein HU200_061972 [Digitaria exilis]|uniref:Uncharacterized protein n=1 Tax=Digitaria exilis TaxID=1010633 RepID=A0A835DXJ0_9POAL|nr:hypothetical protein HU200_061972 [Digitaria exilis]